MTSTSRLFSTSLAFAFCAATCVAQSPAPDAPAPEARRAAVIEQDQPDTHEDQATTRSVSQIRIVRLSQVRGQVQLDRKTGQKFEAAFTNLPIVAGEQLRTQQGVAEVEFEDNSSLRLITDSQVEFPQLGRDISGTTTTTVNLLRGSIYVSLANSKTTGGVHDPRRPSGAHPRPVQPPPPRSRPDDGEAYRLSGHSHRSQRLGVNRRRQAQGDHVRSGVHCRAGLCAS